MPAKKNAERVSLAQHETLTPPTTVTKGRKTHTCTESLIQQLYQIIEASGGSKNNTKESPGTTEEAMTLSLRSCVANALYNGGGPTAPDEVARTYWLDLGFQVEVDRWVEFSRYCANNGFRPLKATYLMECWLSFKQFVEDANIHSDVASENRKEDSTDAPENFQTSPPSLVNGSSELDTMCLKRDQMTSIDRSVGSLPVSFSAQIEQKLRDFVANEIDMGWKWEQAHHIPGTALASFFSPIGPFSLTNASVQRADEESVSACEKNSATATTLTRRKNKGEKTTRQQQLLQQQQEQLDEERRQIAATVSASMPSENIYLTTNEIQGFVNFLSTGLLQHAALYQYISRNPQAVQPNPVDAQGNSANFFSLYCDEPMQIPPLSFSIEMLAAHSAPAEAVPTISTKSSRANTLISSPNPNPAATTSEAMLNRLSSIGNGPEVGSSEKVSPSPLSQLQAMQKQEIDRLVAKHHEEIASNERRARAEQTEREMSLFFESHGTQKAVDDVYASINHDIEQQQGRILQRIKALELHLGIN